MFKTVFDSKNGVSSPRFWFSLPQLPVEGDQDTSKKPLRNQASNLISSFSHMSKFNIKNYLFCIWGFPDNSVGKESACREGDLGFIPGLGRSSGEGNSYPLQYSGLKNSMDCTVHGITESDTTERLSSFHILHFTRKHCSKVILYLISACIVKKKKIALTSSVQCLMQNAPLNVSFTPVLFKTRRV